MACRQVQFVSFTPGGASGSVRRKRVPLWFPKVTREAIWSDAVAPYDFGSHLGSGRTYLRPRLLGLACFMRVGSVGKGTLFARDSTSDR